MRIVLVEFAGEQKFDPKRGQTGLELIQLRGEFPLQTGIAAFLRQIEECRQVVQLRLDIAPLLEFAFQRGFLPADAGRRARVVPKIRLPHLGFEFFQVGGHAGEVKDAPVVPILVRRRHVREHEFRPACNDPFL